MSETLISNRENEQFMLRQDKPSYINPNIATDYVMDTHVWQTPAFAAVLLKHWSNTKEPSIKYVTLFWTNFDPPPSVTHCHTSWEPPKVRHTSRTPNFQQYVHTYKCLYREVCLSSRGFLSGGFVRGFLVWKILFRVVFVHPPSVRIHPLQHKAKHHFQFQVSYV